MKKLIQCCFLLISIAGLSKGAPQIPALISLDLRKQHDTIGYNLVRSIPVLLNEGVHNGNIILWDSPLKEKNISGKFLKQLELANKTQFVEQQFLFIHELWSSTKQGTNVEIIGFSFIGINGVDSSRFNYGYIEMKSIETLLQSSKIPVNINGVFGTTYYDALQQKSYPFTLLQLGNRYYTDADLAEQNRLKYFGNGKVILSSNPLVPVKKVSGYYDIKAADSIFDLKIVFDEFSNYFNQHKEVFFNQGGQRITSHLNTKYKVHITRIDCIGFASQNDLATLISSDAFVLYADGIALDTVYKSTINLWQDDEMQASIKYLNTYQVGFVPRYINDQFIDAKDAALIWAAFTQKHWNTFSEQLQNSRQ